MSINRRTLVSTALFALSTQALAHPLLNFLGKDEAEDRIFGILQKHLGLSQKDRRLVPAFLQKLRTQNLSSEDPATFKRWLGDEKHFADELEAYVLEEFVVSSNYFAVKAGEESQLMIRQA